MFSTEFYPINPVAIFVVLATVDFVTAAVEFQLSKPKFAQNSQEHVVLLKPKRKNVSLLHNNKKS